MTDAKTTTTRRAKRTLTRVDFEAIREDHDANRRILEARTARVIGHAATHDAGKLADVDDYDR
jgi:hypothetical protein